ncbi:MAG: pseudouridine synthase [Solimonas sp.]
MSTAPTGAPPLRDGVGASYVLLPAGPWPRALDFLIERFAAIGEEAWRSRMERGLVLDEQGGRITAGTPYRAGATLWYYRELEREPHIPFEADVLYRDAHLLVADKPHFLPVIPSGRFVQETLLVRLKKEFGISELSPLHRIDRGTAGIVAFSVQAATRGRYQQLFADRAVDKRYEALAPLVPGLVAPFVRRTRLIPAEPFFRMREAPEGSSGEPNSETHIEAIEPRGDGTALWRLRPVTGRKHQLRVHLAALGAPIINDDFYPDVAPQLAAGDDSDGDYTRPLKLLARTLAFRDPLSGEARRFDSRRSL